MLWKKKKEFKQKQVLPENYRCVGDPAPLGLEPGETGIAQHQQLCTKRSAKKIGIICDKKMAFKPCAVTTWLWACSSQLQEHSHIGQVNLALQLYLHGPVCSTSWKVQGCLCPLTLTQTSSVSQNGSARSFGPSQNCFDICFDTEFINVICLLLWTQAACKQVAKHQQDEFFPPPIPTPKPYKTRQGQQSKQMFYICCAFWAQAVLVFSIPFTLIVLL